MANIVYVSDNGDLISTCSKELIDKITFFVHDVLNFLDYDWWDVSVFICADEFMLELNGNYRNINTATDVLSFRQGHTYYDEKGDKYICAGDIVISMETLEKNAESFNVSKDEEIKRLLIHGILHLSDMDHGEYHIDENGNILDAQSNIVEVNDSNSDNEEIKMLVLQESILKNLKDKKIF